MRDYQREKNNQWVLPHNLYRQTLWLIRDYGRLKEDYTDTLEESHAPEGGGHGSKPGDPTGALVCRLENMHDRIRAVEKAREEIPEEYFEGIWNQIVHNRRYPDDADRHTYGRWKARFVWLVAHYLKWI